jgi:hypothetical protein
MSWDPPDSDLPDDEDDDAPEPVRGQVRHSNLSARVPESVGAGVFSNGVMILTGQHECVLDFVLRMGEVQKIVTRVILPPLVAQQFERALRENLRGYDARFGGIPKLPRPQAIPSDEASEAPHEPGMGSGGMAGAGFADQSPPRAPDIDEIYHDLKLPDEMLSGRYANAVLIRHSGTEFCFDFLTNVYPRSAVSCRVFMASPQVPPFLESLSRSLRPQEPDEER